MAKKVNDVKPAKKDSPTSKEVGQVNYYLRLGNYFMARRLAKQAELDTTLSEKDHAAVSLALQITWPDNIALLTGFACLVVTTVVAFIVAY